MVISILLFPFLALVGLILVFGRARGKSKEFRAVPETTADVVDEVADYLKNPNKYRIPKGCLLVGPPGIRKNLLAGEADTSFSDELFVGSPSRVRDLFEKAKSKSPFIVFIDEIGAGNNEQLFQSQTLIGKRWEWDANGIPNSTHKYCEDQKVRWHDTSFEERLDKALSEEFQRKRVFGK